MSLRTLNRRLQGRQTQFHIELVYGVLFIAGFGYLVFRIDPRVAAFEGGLVLGYLLRVWEKMSIYERIIEERVSQEAERQVGHEVEEQVGDEVEEQVADEVATEVQQQVDEEVTEHVEAEVEEQVEAEVGDLDEQIDEHVSQQLEGTDEAPTERSDDPGA